MLLSKAAAADMIREVKMLAALRLHARLRDVALLVLGGVSALTIWLALHPGGSRAGTTPSLVASTLAALQTPSANEFPTPTSAINYLVEQVRAQNVDAATRVLPITYFEQRATFLWQTNRLQSVQINSFFPYQPFSKLEQGLAMLQTNYTFFTVSLLDPKLISSGAEIVSTPQAALQLQARLDPKRLAHIYVQRFTPSYNSAKTSGLELLGVNRLTGGDVVIAGLGAPRTFNVDLARYGTNWMISDIGPK